MGDEDCCQNEDGIIDTANTAATLSLIEALRVNALPYRTDQKRSRDDAQMKATELFDSVSLAAGRLRKQQLEQELEKTREENDILRRSRYEELSHEEQVRMLLDRLRLLYSWAGVNKTTNDFMDSL